jgi:ribosome maturation factor RimP
MGFELVRVALSKGGTLQIMIEPADGRPLDVEECATVSRAVSAVLDVEDLISQAYTLEVSSPGIDRPLTRLADFTDWAGHEVKVELAEPMDGRKNIRGDIVGVDGDNVHVDDRKSGRLTFAFSNMGSAKLLLTDRLIASTAPINSDGADEVEADPIHDEAQED